MSEIYKAGSLVKVRGRDWIVQPSGNPQLLAIKPLGGAEEESTAIYLPLLIPEDKVEKATFPIPTTDDLGDFFTAKLLYNATRLAFRNASGPFRCIGKLSFQPRSYQMVPLVVALKQDITRLLIADDVGIGKTIEALMILRELLERGEIRRFAVICLPHLCEQWQQELKDKLDIEAEVIRSSSAAMLDRKYPGDRSVFYYIPYQVISIDFIKSERRRNQLITDCPELVIVDEAHTCANPQGEDNKTKHQRHNLIADIAKDTKRHLVLLTATPHSGKDPEFISLLSLLKPEFGRLDIDKISKEDQKNVAKHFIQRKRKSIIEWLDGEHLFPERDSKEEPYLLSKLYREYYEESFDFARSICYGADVKDFKNRVRYWAALALMRGIMSSPAAGLEMLRKKTEKKEKKLAQILEEDQPNSNPVLDSSDSETDRVQNDLFDIASLTRKELATIEELSGKIKNLFSLDNDVKANRTIVIVKKWLAEGYQPIVFCKYLATASYVGDHLKANLPKGVDVQVITSELADEQRKEKIESMKHSKQRVLVATDCLSEGINLQDIFSAVLHYDLPWNPNRLEQREGRVDRFGQKKEILSFRTLKGENNPIDMKVWDILVTKVNEIRNALGVSISLGSDENSVTEVLMKELFLGKEHTSKSHQLSFGFETKNELALAIERATRIRSIYEQNSIKKEEIKEVLKEVDQAVGDPAAVLTFTEQTLAWLGCTPHFNGVGYEIPASTLPENLKVYLNKKVGNSYLVSFNSPTPLNYTYLGRNHRFIEQLCQLVLSLAFEKKDNSEKIARSAVIRTKSVDWLTILFQFRVRNVIKEIKGKQEVIAEELYLWGIRHNKNQSEFLSYSDTKKLLDEASSISNIHINDQKNLFNDVMKDFPDLQNEFIKVAESRAEHLVIEHGRYKILVGDRRYEAIKPVLPPDILGMYILVPQPKI